MVIVYKRIAIALILLAGFSGGISWPEPRAVWDNMPPKIREGFGLTPIVGMYELSNRINPLYLRGDFDGDGRADYAVLIKESVSRKRGVAVWLSSLPAPVLLGAGVRTAYGAMLEDDLDFDSWRVASSNVFDQSTKIKQPHGVRADCIFVAKGDNTSGIFFWKNRAFHWLQQGD